jgi:hypothetical protein
VVVSLFGYFFYVVTAFTAAMVLLINFDDSRLISHNPHPIIVVPSATTAQNEQQHLPGSAERQSAQYAPAKDVKKSVAKADLKKHERKRFAHFDASKVLARFGATRETYEGHLRTALGYAEGSGYRPGLDSQR